jgi:hypothetical protein
MPKKKRSMILCCINKWFFKILPELRVIGEDPMFKQICGASIHSLGAEGAFERCLELFDDGILFINAESTQNFIIYGIINNKAIIFYDTETNKMLNGDK